MPRREVFSTGRSPAAEALLSIFTISLAITTAIGARRNLRTGASDVVAARQLAIFVALSSLASLLLRAHYVPAGTAETFWLLAVTGWSLLWAGVSWMGYVSCEPYLRRRLPGTLISWTRAMAGRLRDPLVGRDVLIGLLAGVCVTALVIARLQASHQTPPDLLRGQALVSLQSPREALAVIVFAVQDGLLWSVALLVSIVLIRQLVRKTWIVVAILMTVASPLSPAALRDVRISRISFCSASLCFSRRCVLGC